MKVSEISTAGSRQPAEFEPGDYVILPTKPDWGQGQVQSATGNRVTVHFDHAGKITIDTNHATLEKNFPTPMSTSGELR